jgi:hypothetical protein
MFVRSSTRSPGPDQPDPHFASLGRAGRWHEIPVEYREQAQAAIHAGRRRSSLRLPHEPWTAPKVSVRREMVEAIRMAAAYFLVSADNAERELLDAGRSSDQKRAALDWTSVDSRILANELIDLAEEMVGCAPQAAPMNMAGI